MYTYKSLHAKAPAYLAELLHEYTPPRALRSQDQCLLKEPCSRLKTLGERGVAYSAPRLWNKLPANVKAAQTVDSFKQKLKSLMFTSR